MEASEAVAVEGRNLSSRLARNRKTARLRRERKKQEAERLTGLRTEVINRKTQLLEKLAEFKSSDGSFESFSKQQMDFIPSGCLFCNRIFSVCAKSGTNDISDHYLSDHPNDVKSNQIYLGKDFISLVNDPLKLLDHVTRLSEENGKTNHDTLSPSLRKLSSEEKKKRRLERNAESARLCRQRKKLYIQRIRLELPILQREIELLSEFLGEEKPDNILLFNSNNHNHNKSNRSRSKESEEESVCTSVSSKSEIELSKSSSTPLPPLTGWDTSQKRSKRSFSCLDDVSESLSPTQTPKLLRSNNFLFGDQNQQQQALQQFLTLNNLMLAATLQKMAQFNLPPQAQSKNNSSGESDVVEAAFALSNLARMD